jgi:hypothetical protein
MVETMTSTRLLLVLLMCLSAGSVRAQPGGAQAPSGPAAENDLAKQLSNPINVTVTKITGFGPFPMSNGGGLGGFVASPDGGPSWRLRLVATLLLPVQRPPAR